jgi:GNAT superfamily N-acetyltransferase
MTDLSIRRAAPRDVLAIASVLAAAYAAHRIRLPDLPDVTGGIAEDISTHDVRVAEIDGRIVGAAVLVAGEGVAHLANVGVHPDAAGRGVGKALIAVAETVARKNGAVRIDLATHVGMPDNVALYRHLGWHETGRVGNKVYMSKPLS